MGVFLIFKERADLNPEASWILWDFSCSQTNLS